MIDCSQMRKRNALHITPDKFGSKKKKEKKTDPFVFLD